MVVVRPHSNALWPDLATDKEYRVMALSIPVPGVTFLRIVDESGEDYLYPADSFDVIEGADELEEMASRDPRREYLLA